MFFIALMAALLDVFGISASFGVFAHLQINPYLCSKKLVAKHIDDR